MSNTKLLEHPNGIVKSDLLQSTLETQLRLWRMLLVGQLCQLSMGSICGGVGGMNHVVLTMFYSGVFAMTLHMFALT